MRYAWENLAEDVWRTRLPFLDVTVGAVRGEHGVLLVDAGTTLAETRGIRADVETLTGTRVRWIVFTHSHFDHVLGSAGFPDAEVYCAPGVAAAIEEEVAGGKRLRDEALHHGADAHELDETVAALRVPAPHQIRDTEHVVDLGIRTVTVTHPGSGHTDHDLVVLVPGDPTVVFCGDLVEESGDPAVGPDSDLGGWPHALDTLVRSAGEDAVYVPGHGAVVDANFVRRQRQWLLDRLAAGDGA